MKTESIYFLDGRKAFAHQIEDSNQMAAKRGMILASEMGTGKTRTVLMTAKALQGCTPFPMPVLVICPPAVMGHWAREANNVGLRISTFSWGNIPDPYDDLDYILIVDEFHYGGNATAQRTKSMMEWGKRAAHVYALSGTPMMNARAKELFPILKVLGHPIAESKVAYEKTYCGGHWEAIGKGAKWNYNGFELRWTCRACGGESRFKVGPKKKKGSPIACSECEARYAMPQVFWDNRSTTNTDELANHLKGWMIRRLKKDCLDLPPKTRKMLRVDPTEEQIERYESAVAGILSGLEDLERDRDIQPTDVITGMVKARLAASVLKTHEAIRVVKELNEAGHRVVVFAEFLETIKAIAGAFRGKAMIGDSSPAQRTKMIAEFQAGKRINFMATTKTGGAGVDLTAADYVLLVDRPWNMATIEQAEDRPHRPGQTLPLTVLWLSMFDIDLYVDQVCLGKGRVSQAVLSQGEKITESNVALAVMGALAAARRKD